MSTETDRTHPDPRTEYRWAVLEGANPAGEVVVSVHDTSEEAMATLRQLVHLAPTATARLDLFVGTVEHYHQLPTPRPDQDPVGSATLTSATATAYRNSDNTSMWDDLWTFEELQQGIDAAGGEFEEVTELGREFSFVETNDDGDTRRRWAELDQLAAVCAISKDGAVTVVTIDEYFDERRHTLPEGTETVVEIPATTLHRDGEPTLADLAAAGPEAPAWVIDEDGWAEPLEPLEAQRPNEPTPDVAECDMGGLDL